MERPTIVLFDVDGTLVLTGGAGRRALARAFDEAFGCPGALEGVSLGGMTDRSIVRSGLQAAGVAPDEAAIDALLERYLSYLPDELTRSQDYRIMPGAHAAVEVVRARPRCAVGLGTGNVARGAELKLERGGLASAFGFGGFGSDHEDRVELLRIGAQRGAQVLAEPLHRCRLVIVGDTPRDVHAARALQADCVAVGTGGHEPVRLLELGATTAFEDLRAPGAVDAILGPA